MSAETTTVRRGGVWRWVMPAAAATLAAGLCSLAPASQAALAASQGVASISAGGEHACTIIGGQGYCWGENFNGELGNGTNTNSTVPVPVDTSGVLAGKTLTQISAGYENTCALDSAGAVYCWGWNGYGQLGDGSTTSSDVPVAVDTGGALAGAAVSQITSGAYVTCAIDAAGAAYCWGFDGYGELGNGTNTNSSVPVAVDTSGALAGKTLTQINASWYHTCAVDSTGAAYCWGRNAYGQLGDASYADSSVPVAVAASGALAGKTLIQITAGAYDTCAVDADGAAYCWGYNRYGELGNASTTSSGVPVAVDSGGVLADRTLTQVTAGTWHTCAVDDTGAAYCWGRNGSGELGDDGFGLQSLVPLLVGL